MLAIEFVTPRYSVFVVRKIDRARETLKLNRATVLFFDV